MSPAHPVQHLEGKSLGPYALRLTRLEPMAKSGWRLFELTLSGPEGDFAPPVVTGIHSVGGRGVLPWVEVLDYRPRLECQGRVLDLAAQERDVALFGLLAGLFPPGGHIMVGCEGAAHRETHLAALKGVPPIATPLGWVLFRAGFPRVRFFGLAEGGWEGQQKLWAEKPLDEDAARRWRDATADELRRFLAQAPSAATLLPHAGRAAAILAVLAAQR